MALASGIDSRNQVSRSGVVSSIPELAMCAIPLPILIFWPSGPFALAVLLVLIVILLFLRFQVCHFSRVKGAGRAERLPGRYSVGHVLFV